MLNRRQFIQSFVSAGAALSLPSLGYANPVRGRKFLFVITEGGWDPLCVFAPLFDATAIDMEPDAQHMSIGDFRLVDHAERPSVRAFFETWGDSTLVIDGLSTRSVSHEVCAEIAMTGNSSGSGVDWPTLIALGDQDRYAMPSLVFSGIDRAFAPTFPGEYESLVVRTGPQNQLQAMLQGYYIEETDIFVEPMPPQARTILDRFVREKSRRLEAQFSRRGGDKLLRDFQQSLAQVKQLQDLGGELNFSVDEGDVSSIDSAISALSMGLSRCVTLSDGRNWDTHDDNSLQNPQFEAFFSELDSMLVKMANTSGTQADSLLDETIIVVMSEMGRTPKFNATGGRDHWPYTSVMLIGNDIAGGRSLGGYTENFSGIGFDHRTGVLMPDTVGVSAFDFGATLLTLADMEPASVLSNARPFEGVLR